MGAELVTGILGGIVAALGLAYTYWRGRIAGRQSQQGQFERFYERLTDLPEDEVACFFEPAGVTELTNRQKALLVWYFTICSSAFLQMKHGHVERESAMAFMASLSQKFGAVPGLAALLRGEGFDGDFLAAVGLEPKHET